MKLRLSGKAAKGVNVEIVSPEQAEQAACLVCLRVADLPVGYFVDDLFAACCDCGALVRYRPHAPQAPPKVCLQCAAARAKRGA